MTCELKVFTLNCWGIPVVSKDRKLRMAAIAEYLAQNRFDVVCLQEIWSNSDFNLIKDKVSEVLPYAHYFHSGVIGSGICIFCKYPICEVFFHQWPVNGYAHKLQHADWFGGKGVGYCRLQLKDFNVNIYSAHLHAEYNRQCDEYEAHRVLQAFDTAQFIQLTSGDADLVILAGDLNTEPNDLAYRIIAAVTNLKDSYIEAARLDPSKPCNTNEIPQNTYTPKALAKKQYPGKRIDYIMYSTSNRKSVVNKRLSGNYNVAGVLKSYCQPLQEQIPQRNCSYSDHEAVLAEIQLKIIKENHSDHDVQHEGVMDDIVLDEEVNTNLESILKESIAVCESALERLKAHQRIYGFFSVIILVLMVVTFVVHTPFDWTIFYHVVRILLTFFFCFTFVMATLWNSIEASAVLAGKLSMELNLGKVKANKLQTKYEEI